MPDQKRPVDRLLDVFVYAPLGLVMNLEDVVPQLIEKGHQQVNMARMFGQFAVQAGSQEARKRVEAVSGQATAIVEQAVGTVNRRSVAPPAAPAASQPAPAAAPTADVPDADTLSIPDYDALSASQVVPRLGGLSAGELDAVRRYESANRGRKTILSKIAQLQG